MATALLGTVFAAKAVPQSAQDTQGAATDPNTALGAPVTVHGVVMNAASGEPLPRALVQINGGSGEAVLTDGDGRFEVAGVPLGPSVFQLTKPGFEDAAGAQKGEVLRDLRGYTHDVFVTEITPALVFSMRPTNTIRGQIELSTGDVAQNIGVTLLQKQILNGRSVWKQALGTRTNAEGAYHFAHLADGDYAVLAEPAPQADSGGFPDAPLEKDALWNGYPEVYYPDAHDFSGAARIHLAGGEQAQAILKMPLAAFHQVRASVLLPQAMTDGIVQTEVVGQSGSSVQYPSHQAESHTVWALLPDGDFTIRVTSMRSDSSYTLRYPNKPQSLMGGQTDVTVAGHSVTNLRIPVGPVAGSPLDVIVSRTAQAGTGPGGGRKGQVFVELSQAGLLTDGMQGMFAQGAGPGMLDTAPVAPGKYWVHTIVADPALCEDSLTAGGANLGREPLVVGPAGATGALTLNLRDDCASLKVSLPRTVAGMTAGDAPGYLVYVVPDRDFTTDAPSQTLRATNGSSFTFPALTPGSYRVYVFSAPVDLEYHNRDVLEELHGQAVTLTPGQTAELVLEVPSQ